jgi:hypothetical protein
MEYLARETEVLRENCCFVHHKSHMNLGRHGGKLAINRLSCGTASTLSYVAYYLLM